MLWAACASLSADSLPDGRQGRLAEAHGNLTLAKSFTPYGEVLNSTGGEGIDIHHGFTGEWLDSYIELLYLRSRYYSLKTGRFLTKDTWQGDYTKPISLNKWIYALANPQRWIDNSGLCPKPAGGTGKVICIDLFIKTATILFGTGYGDGRDFSYDSPPEKSRGYIYVYLDQQNKLDHSDLHVDNPSCTTFGCFGPYPQFNKFNVIPNPSSSEIYVSWSLLNGFSGYLRKDVADALWFESHGIGQILSIVSRCASILIASIDGNLTLANDAGFWELKRLDRDPYPSLEIYYYADGEYKYTISTRDEKPSERPDIGLNPIAINDRIP
jgi:RHS repeat-associated protein